MKNNSRFLPLAVFALSPPLRSLTAWCGRALLVLPPACLRVMDIPPSEHQAEQASKYACSRMTRKGRQLKENREEK